MSDEKYISFWLPDAEDDEPEDVVDITTAEHLNSLGKREAAEFLAKEFGWYVIPCKRLTKNPGSLLGKDWPTRSTRDIERIRIWWKKWPDAEVAVHCGKSGIIAFDVDHGDEVPDWLQDEFSAQGVAKHCTSANGERAHYIFNVPDGLILGNGRGKMPKNIGEVRGKNGVIIVGPSEHMKVDEGGHYWWRHIEKPLRGISDELIELLGEGNADEGGRVLNSNELEEFLDGWVEEQRGFLLDNILEGYKDEVFENGAGRHDSMGKYLVWAFREARCGQYSARRAYDALKDLWEQSFEVPRLGEAMSAGRKPGLGEYESIARWAAGEACNDDSSARSAEIDARYSGDGSGVSGGEGKGLKKASLYADSDRGNAEHMYDLYRGEIFWAVDTKRWYVWNENDKEWSTREEIFEYSISVSQRLLEEAKNLERQMAKKLKENDGAGDEKKGDGGKGDDIGGMLRQRSKATAGTRTQENFLKQFRNMVEIDSSLFDAEKKYLATQNGLLILDPLNGAENCFDFRDIEYDDYVTMKCAVGYRPWPELKEENDRGFQLWNEFLEKFLPGDDKLWLQKFMGYMLYGGNPERKILFLQGIGGTGKTTFLDSIAKCLGAYGSKFNNTLLRSEKDNGPRPDINNAANKRLIWNSELSAKTELHADQLKRITGNEPLLAINKHQNEDHERVPAFVPVIATNGFPKIQDEDIATRGRIWAYPFDFSTTTDEYGRPKDGENDVQAHDRLIEYGLEAILSWMVEGWKMYVAKGIGGDNVPFCVIERTLKCFSNMSDFQVWLEEKCNQGAECMESPNVLWHSYQQWMEENHVRPANRISRRQFWDKLSENGFEAKPIRLDPASRKQTVMRLRIGLKQDENFKDIIS